MHAEVRDGARVFWPERTGREVGVDSRVALDPSGSLCDLRRFSHEAMATVYEVYASHADQRYAAQAAQAAFDMIDRLERELSRFLPNSDITRVNRLAPGERTRVSPATMECLSIARHMFELTGGAFDVSMGSGLRLLELDPDESLVMARARGSDWTSAALARATRSIWWRSCSRNGGCPPRSCMAGSAPSSPSTHRLATTAGR
jgi:hypothetical protein